MYFKDEHKEPPHNADAERSLIGLLLSENSFFCDCTDLHPEHFYEPVHQRIYQATLEIISRNETATPVTLKSMFDNDAALSDIGGAGYLVKMVVNASFTDRVSDLASEIINQWQRRKIIISCKEAIERAADFTVVPNEVSADLVAEINDLDDLQKRNVVMTEQKVIQDIVEDLKVSGEPDSTGIPRLDAALGGGLFPSMLYGFCARKKVGKTAFAATLAHNLAEKNVKHLFIAAEMGAKQIHQRVMARKLDVYPSIFRSEAGRTTDFMARVALASGQTTRSLLYQNAAGLTFNELKQYCARAVYKHKVKGIILDYLQIVGGEGSQGKVSHLDSVSQWLADFTKKHDIWIVVLAQLNQDGNTRFGEGIRLAAEMVMGIHREDVSQPDTWLEMMDTRYTPWMNIGDEHNAGLMLREKGVFFEEV